MTSTIGPLQLYGSEGILTCREHQGVVERDAHIACATSINNLMKEMQDQGKCAPANFHVMVTDNQVHLTDTHGHMYQIDVGGNPRLQSLAQNVIGIANNIWQAHQHQSHSAFPTSFSSSRSVSHIPTSASTCSSHSHCASASHLPAATIPPMPYQFPFRADSASPPPSASAASMSSSGPIAGAASHTPSLPSASSSPEDDSPSAPLVRPSLQDESPVGDTSRRIPAPRSFGRETCIDERALGSTPLGPQHPVAPLDSSASSSLDPIPSPSLEAEEDREAASSIAILNRSHEVAATLKDMLSEKNRVLTEALTTKTTDLDQAHKKIESLEASISTHEINSTRLSLNITALQRQMEEGEAETTKLKNELAEALKKKNEAIERADYNGLLLVQLDRKIKTLEKQLQTALYQKAGLEQDVVRAREQRSQAEADSALIQRLFDDQKLQCEQLKKETAILRELLNKAVKSLAEAKKALEDSFTEIDELRKQGTLTIDEMKLRLKDYERQVDRLTTLLEEAEDANANDIATFIVTHLNPKTEKIKELEEELRKAKEATQTLQRQLEHARSTAKEVDDQEEDLEHAQQDVAQLTRDLHVMRKEKRKLSKILTSLAPKKARGKKSPSSATPERIQLRKSLTRATPFRERLKALPVTPKPTSSDTAHRLADPSKQFGDELMKLRTSVSVIRADIQRISERFFKGNGWHREANEDFQDLLSKVRTSRNNARLSVRSSEAEALIAVLDALEAALRDADIRNMSLDPKLAFLEKLKDIADERLRTKAIDSTPPALSSSSSTPPASPRSGEAGSLPPDGPSEPSSPIDGYSDDGYETTFP